MSDRGTVICLVAIMGAGLAGAQVSPFRQPLGIYVRDTSGCNLGENQTKDQCLTAKAAALVANPGVAGIDASLQWSDLNPSPGVYAWNEIEDIFNAVDSWNQSHPSQPRKTVQIDVNPGFQSPPWLFANMASCDPMFETLPEANPDGTLNKSYVAYNPPRPDLVPRDCGYVTFIEAENSAMPLLPLPLPWSPYYKSAWETFVRALAQKYGGNPDVVSVQIAGPTASSAEMILPNEQHDAADFYKWNYLMALTFPPSYQNTDRAFVEAWQDAIDLYGQAFSGLTLIITTGNGLPNFLGPVLPIGQANTTGTPLTTVTVPPGFQPACGSPDVTNIMDCAAEESVVAYFAEPLHGGFNLKASQESGFGAGGINHSPLGGGDLGSWGIWWLAQISQNGITLLPASFTFVSKIFGGFQSGGPITGDPAQIAQDLQNQGCNLPGNRNCPGLTPEQAVYNFMQNFFDGTELGSVYGPNPALDQYGPAIVPGTIPLNYLQLYDVDINYATANACDIPGGSCTQNVVTDGAGHQSVQSFQSILERVAAQIWQIADPTLSLRQLF